MLVVPPEGVFCVRKKRGMGWKVREIVKHRHRYRPRCEMVLCEAVCARVHFSSQVSRQMLLVKFRPVKCWVDVRLAHSSG